MPTRSLDVRSDNSSAGPLTGREFRWFFVGRTVSSLGSSMTPVALAFAVLQLTNSTRYLSYILSAEMIPMVSLLIVGGGIADRYRRDRLLVITNIICGISQSGIAACVLTGRPIWLLIPLAFINGTSQAFISPSMRGIIPQLVDASAVQKANSLVSSFLNAARIFGPSIAGILVAAASGGWGIAFDAASFLIAALCFSWLSLPDPPKPQKGMLGDLRSGWTYFRTTSWIWSVTSLFAVTNAIQMGVWQILGPEISKHTIGSSGWGIVQSAKAVGLLLGSIATLKLTIRRPMVSGLVWMSVSAFPLIVLGAHPQVFALSAVTFLAGIGSAYFGIVWDTARQANIPNSLISRVSSYDDFGAFVTIPVGQLAAIPIAAAIGLPRAAEWGGVIYLIVTLLPLTLLSVRRVRLSP